MVLIKMEAHNQGEQKKKNKLEWQGAVIISIPSIFQENSELKFC